MKKAVSLSMNMIVLSILALLVLIVMMVIFGGKANIFSKMLGGCEERGGVCEYTEQQCKDLGGQPTSFKCKEKNVVCCLSKCATLGGICKNKCEEGQEMSYASCFEGDCCKK